MKVPHTLKNLVAVRVGRKLVYQAKKGYCWEEDLLGYADDLVRDLCPVMIDTCHVGILDLETGLFSFSTMKLPFQNELAGYIGTRKSFESTLRRLIPEQDQARSSILGILQSIGQKVKAAEEQLADGLVPNGNLISAVARKLPELEETYRIARRGPFDLTNWDHDLNVYSTPDAEELSVISSPEHKKNEPVECIVFLYKGATDEN